MDCSLDSKECFQDSRECSSGVMEWFLELRECSLGVMRCSLIVIKCNINSWVGSQGSKECILHTRKFIYLINYKLFKFLV